MPYAIAELLAILAMFFLVGTFIILFPISRRLGKAIEEWVKIRHESSPERDLLARIEVDLLELRNQFDGLDQRLDFIAERQEFTESLIDQKRRTALPPDADQTTAPGTEEARRSSTGLPDCSAAFGQLVERRDPGDRHAKDQAVDVVRSLVRVDRFEVGHVTHRLVLDEDSVSAQ